VRGHGGIDSDSGSDSDSNGISPIPIHTENISALSYDDYTRITIVNTIRPTICCQRSSSRACGYIVRPEIRLPRITQRITKYLEAIGLTPRKKYVKPEEITRVLSIVKGLEDLVKDTDSLDLVQRLNGVLKQPTTHDEVIQAFDLIENTVSIDKVNPAGGNPTWERL